MGALVILLIVLIMAATAWRWGTGSRHSDEPRDRNW
jgi:hypothetical protein